MIEVHSVYYMQIKLSMLSQIFVMSISCAMTIEVKMHLQLKKQNKTKTKKQKKNPNGVNLWCTYK